jgi:hypothetical protein
LPFAAAEESAELTTLTGDFSETEVVVRSLNIDDVFDRVIISPATPTAPGQLSAGVLIRAAAWQARVIVLRLSLLSMQATHISKIMPACVQTAVQETQQRLKKTAIKKRRSGVDTTFGHVNGPDTVSALLKQANEKDLEKEAKKQRKENKLQEAERKVLENAENLKKVEQSFRDGNKSLGRPLTRFFYFNLVSVPFSSDHCL